MIGIFADSRLFTYFRLVTHFFCGLNARLFARGDCNK